MCAYDTARWVAGVPGGLVLAALVFLVCSAFDFVFFSCLCLEAVGWWFGSVVVVCCVVCLVYLVSYLCWDACRLWCSCVV